MQRPLRFDGSMTNHLIKHYFRSAYIVNFTTIGDQLPPLVLFLSQWKILQQRQYCNKILTFIPNHSSLRMRTVIDEFSNYPVSYYLETTITEISSISKHNNWTAFTGNSVSNTGSWYIYTLPAKSLWHPIYILIKST